MKTIKLFAVFLLFTFISNENLISKSIEKQQFGEINFNIFTQIPPLPDNKVQKGFAGAFSGIIGDNLIIAGGANFPDKLPFEGGIKTYWSDIYAFSFKNKSWKIFKNALPNKTAYGVSISLPQGILCIGGNDNKNVYSDVFLVKYENDTFEFEKWPSLPVPLTNMAGILLDNKIYIAGGQQSISSPNATNSFFVMDINGGAKKWHSLSSWPGPSRIYPVLAEQSDGFDNCIYLFSGRDLGPDRKLKVLSDAYEYNPRLKHWKKLDNDSLQFPVMAGTAFPSGANHIILLGGANNSTIEIEDSLKKRMNKYIVNVKGIPENDSIEYYKTLINGLGKSKNVFSKDVLLYHTITKTLIKQSQSKLNIPVNTNIVNYNGKHLLCSGEIRPGVRTPDIISVETIPYKGKFGILNIIVIVLYFGVLLWMGIFFSRRQKSSNDYFKGGGRLPWWAVGLSIFGTALSAITFMAIPAKAYASDWSYLLMNSGIILVSPIIVFLFIPFFRRLNVSTAYEYLELRFNLATRLICSGSYILFQVGRMAIVLLLPSIALNVVTGIDIFLCVSLMGVLSLAYTMMGGIEAVVWTDALQVVVLLGGAIFAIVYIALNIEGGFSTIISQGIIDRKFALGSTSFDVLNPTIWTVVIASLFANITTYGTDQTMVQRYLTTKDEKMANKSVWLNAALTVPATLIFFFIGTCLYLFYKTHPALLNITISDGDAIFPWFIFSQMPPGVTGLLISGIFAAAMSTLSSSMNSAATAYAVDIHFRFGWSKNVDQLKMARIFTLILGTIGILLAVLMATWKFNSLWDEFQKILGLILGGLGGLFLLGLLTKRTSGIAAIIGIIGSILVQMYLSYNQSVHLLLFAATGFISCFIIGYAASFIFPNKKNNIQSLTIYGLKNKNQ